MADPEITPPKGLTPKAVLRIPAPEPFEISGVAALPGGFAVVGDEIAHEGRIWPGGASFALPKGLKGPESLAIATNPAGETLWLILGEQRGRLVDLDGGSHDFDEQFAETAGRGLEGVAVRWQDGRWQVAVVWEGGFFDPKSDRKGRHALPRLALFDWAPGEGVTGPIREVFLRVPEPGEKYRFRAPDLAWMGDRLRILLSSTNAKRSRRRHVWLQDFSLSGDPVGQPIRLEERWGKFATNRNWEGLDHALAPGWMVLSHDAKKAKEQFLVVFRAD